MEVWSHLKIFEALSLRPLVANPADLGDEEDEVRSSGSRCILQCILCFFRQDLQRWNKNIKNGDCDDCDDYLFLIVQMYSCLCHAGKCCRMFIALAAWGAMFLWKSGFEVQPLNEKTALNHGSCFFDPLWFLWGFKHFCNSCCRPMWWSGRVLALQLLLLLELAAGATWNILKPPDQVRQSIIGIIGNLPCGLCCQGPSLDTSCILLLFLLLFLSSW